MNKKEAMEEQVIRKYQQDEETMILLFAQWCINHDLDPEALYQRAYPHQPKNHVLTKMMERTVSKEESEPISNQLMLDVLQLFGNDDLAFVVHEEIAKQSSD
ncbi:hypothetical protein P5G51_017725 [Virgibacillus sp. 179-BFC.A HS]|uniref:Uncharacterized protein n=1 Tax=Tigheibacillus jepli TaxID=3035914 RepID=A0ABU5CMB7_9BACI|nr:hypothetical protein [Virgibacillus sp. 179-BFC.A HS]MDY0406934.1 hypothetical protein [Virgibacillus sp. 179-BFC.A HS]